VGRRELLTAAIAELQRVVNCLEAWTEKATMEVRFLADTWPPPGQKSMPEFVQKFALAPSQLLFLDERGSTTPQ
jgi:hypothetical protein